MLAVESVFDVIADINLVNHLVSILLQRRSEDYNLIVLGHSFDELHATRSHKEEAIVLIFNVVNQCLVQVKHKAVTICLIRL